MKNKIIIVIPTHKLHFNDDEIDSLNRCSLILNKYDNVVLIPYNIKDDEIVQFQNKYPNFHIKKISESSFRNMRSYNNMCLQKWFYEMFKEYEYMLLYQTDGIVFYDKLEFWCDKNYDYIGAPWCYMCNYSNCNQNKEKRVGNGGVSLRKIKVFLEKLPNDVDINGAEDVYISEMNLKTPTCGEAKKFSTETGPYFEINKETMPMFGHKLYQYNKNLIETIDNLIKEK